MLSYEGKIYESMTENAQCHKANLKLSTLLKETSLVINQSEFVSIKC